MLAEVREVKGYTVPCRRSGNFFLNIIFGSFIISKTWLKLEADPKFVEKKPFSVPGFGFGGFVGGIRKKVRIRPKQTEAKIS